MARGRTIPTTSFPTNCDAAELGQFIEQSRSYASGWLGFYWGQTPQQLRSSTQPADVLMLNWLDLFQKMRPMVMGTNQGVGSSIE